MILLRVTQAIESPRVVGLLGMVNPLGVRDFTVRAHALRAHCKRVSRAMGVNLTYVYYRACFQAPVTCDV
jgi:hypothetical protein